MARLILDTGALIAADRGDRRLLAAVKAKAVIGDHAVTAAGSVAQAWRAGPRQARLAMLLSETSTAPLDEKHARRCGALLARTGGNDIVDASVALLARSGDCVLTSDLHDIAELIEARGLRDRVRVIHV